MRIASPGLTRSPSAAVLFMLSPAALAMRQCPPESKKSDAFMLLGVSIFWLFVFAGAVLLLLIFRATRSARPWPRWLLRIAGIPAMLALWMLGLGIYYFRFVLMC